MKPSREQFRGCLLGLALGDALGAPREGGWLERRLWRWIGTTRQGLPRWTDDTQMSLDVADVLLHVGEIDQDRLAQTFARHYRWSRGYGPSTARLLRRIQRGADWRQARTAQFPQGSYGNGAAMRVAPLALWFHADVSQLLTQTQLAAEVTHAHPLAQEGACALALAIHMALTQTEVAELGAALWPQLQVHCTDPAWHARLIQAHTWWHTQASPPPQWVAQRLGHGVAAHESVITAIYAALCHLDADFLDLLAFVAGLGGDVDTLGAMAGAIWGAHRGAAGLTEWPLERRAQVLAIADQLYAHAPA
jgi:poly(ADP-ribose) glycohydrolase ARH3